MVKPLFQISLTNQVISREICRKAAVMQTGIVVGNIVSGCGIVGICMICSTLVKLLIQPVFNFLINHWCGDTDHNQSGQNFKQNKTFIVVFLHGVTLRCEKWHKEKK